MKQMFPAAESERLVKDINKEIFGTEILVDSEIEKCKYSRIVVDSLTTFTSFLERKGEVRRAVHELMDFLRITGATCLFTSELREKEEGLSADGSSEFLVDGIIVLHYTGIGGEEFSNIEVRKMRGTDHARGYYPIEITNNGILIKSEDVKRVLLK